MDCRISQEIIETQGTSVHYFKSATCYNLIRISLLIYHQKIRKQTMKMYSSKKPTIFIQSILFSLLLFIAQYPLASQATCNCDLSLHNPNSSLTERLSPPNFRMANFIPLTNIQPAINYHNLTELYVKVVERYQSLTVIKDLMGKRINETVPPPHHHCFIPERSPQNFLETNSSRFQSRLTDDLCMMVGLDKALNWSIQYERENRRNQFTTCLGNVKHSIEQIIVGLSNITSVPVTYCMTNGDTRVFMESRRRSDEVESEVMYETSQPSPNDIPDSTQPSRSQLGDPGSDPFLEQEITRSPISAEERVTATQSPMSSPAPGCGRISSANQQFTYIYEVWVGMFYLQNDLLPMRDEYAPY